MREYAARAQPAVLRAATGVILATECFRPHFEEGCGGGYPAQLHAVIAVLATQEGLIRQWAIEEIIGMCMMAVEVANRGEEAAQPQAQAMGQRSGFDVRLFDPKLVLAVFTANRRGQLAVELVIDIGGERDLAFTQRKSIRAGTATLARPREPCTGVAGRIQ